MIDPYACDNLDLFIFANFLVGRTNGRLDNRRNVLALAAAREAGLEDEVRGMILECRRQWLVRATVLQREWMRRESHRPQRGRHHDSWSIREKYVRCAS